jgi:hypothetical protein
MKKIIILLLIAFAVKGFAQETPEKGAQEPIELPKFIIVGRYDPSVQYGIKQKPEKPAPLSKAQLDSLNSLEKQQSPSIPIEPLVTDALPGEYKKGFVEADFGSFITGSLRGGYGINLEGYELYGTGGIEASSGHEDDAEYNSFHMQLSSDYIAPDKFFIFGGSRTRTLFKVNHDSYDLYGADNPMDRAATQMNLRVDVDGNYEGIGFSTGGGYRLLRLKTDEYITNDNNLNGYVKVNKLWKNFHLAGNLSLDFNSLRKNSVNFLQADGSAAIISDHLSIFGKAGFQVAQNSDEVNRSGLLLQGRIDYRMNDIFTISGSAESGLQKRFFRDYYLENPYLSNIAHFDYTYNIMLIKGNLFFHPTDKFALTGGVDFRYANRYPYFFPETDQRALGSFGLRYEDATIFAIRGEIFWQPAENDRFVANLTMNQTNLNEVDDNAIPYLAPFNLSGKWHRNWTNKIGTNIGIDYIGEREANDSNSVQIDAFINLTAGIIYKINDRFTARANLENLLASDIYIWEGYKERGLFLSVGLMWQF